MAITFNVKDDCYYGTNAERLAAPMSMFAEMDKFYEYDTGNAYITNGTTWYPM